MTVSADQSRPDQLSSAVRVESSTEHAIPGQKEISAPRSGSRWPRIVLVLLLVFAAGVRIRATHDDLWLDELISLRVAHAVENPWQVFTAVHNDNNHYLSTLYLYFLRHQDSAPRFRYFSVLCGIALVVAGYWLLSYRSRIEGLILAAILACSYPLIHFSSEARGYSGALLGTVLACGALVRWLRNDRRPSFALGLLFGIATGFALLSHLTSCLIWLPVAVASLLVLMSRPQRLKWLMYWAALNFLPASAFAALYLLDLRFVVPLGATPMPVAHGLSRLLALGLGWPARDGISVWVVMLPLAGLIVWQLAKEQKKGEILPMLLAPIYLVPVVFVFLLNPSFFSPRYLLVILPFIYVYGAVLLARLLESRMGCIAFVAVLALFVAGQSYLYSRFLQVGRGQLTTALEYISSHSASPLISVASNQNFRSAIELGYFAKRVLKNGQTLFYVSPEDLRFVQPEWYILHEEGSDPAGPAVLKESGRPTWQRVAYFGASELSGQAWTIYRRLPAN